QKLDMTKTRSGHRSSRSLSNVGLSLFALCIVTTAAHGASSTIPVGGTGGVPFNTLCPPRQVLIAFSMNTGKALDAIAPMCKPIKANGTIPLQQPFTGPFKGGKGGDHSHVLSCPQNTFVGNLNVFVDRFNIVNHIEIQCRNLKSFVPV